MRIGELADQLGINTKTIRYYEEIGLVPRAPRTPSGYRDYREADVARLAFIKSAQRLGLSLEEVREILSLRERGEAPCAYVRDVIGQHPARQSRQRFGWCGEDLRRAVGLDTIRAALAVTTPCNSSCGPA